MGEVEQMEEIALCETRASGLYQQGNDSHLQLGTQSACVAQ